MKKYVAILSCVFFFSACEETIDLDLDQTPPKIVIEGLVTDQAGYQFVKVSRSVGFYTAGETPRVTDAQVTVSDDLGESITFIHNPNNHPDSVGFYIPAVPFKGSIGRHYYLRVTADGEVYEAEDLLAPVLTIDSVKYRINENEAAEPEEPGKIYEMLLYAREPQDVKNYYLFKFFRNGSPVLYNETDIYYSDDNLLQENIDGVPSPVYYGLGDRASVELFSLSRRCYVFYNDLWTILNNDGGGMFGPIPASPRTNLSNDALGFFQVSAVTKAEVLVE